MTNRFRFGHLARTKTAGQLRELDFTPWGGAYNHVATDATAFAHREELFLLLHVVVTGPDARRREGGRAALAEAVVGDGASLGFGWRLPQFPRPRSYGLGVRLPRDEP